jgi:PKD repeat protein
MSVYFQGNAPSADSTVFSGDTGTVYYLPGTTGWYSPFGGLSAVQLNPFVIQYTAIPTNGIVPLTAHFTSPGADNFNNIITRWNWTFGDGSTSAAQNPSHVYTSAGTFQPSLVATNSLGSAVSGSGPAITAGAAGNIVSNGGFETGGFSGWNTSGNFASTSVNTGSVYAHSGTYGAILGPVGSLGYLSQTLTTTPGTSYLLSFWLNSPDGQTPN